jgi:hypothetical protein
VEDPRIGSNSSHRILRKQMQGRVQLTARERKILAALGQKLDKKALEVLMAQARAEQMRLVSADGQFAP